MISNAYGRSVLTGESEIEYSITISLYELCIGLVDKVAWARFMNAHSDFIYDAFIVAPSDWYLIWKSALLFQETTYLYIPNNAVGAIIGTKGSHIRNMIRFSGASVKIAPMDENQKDSQQAERKVTIVGSPESQWKVGLIMPSG